MNAPEKKPSLLQRRVLLPASILLGILTLLVAWLPLLFCRGCAMVPHSCDLSALNNLRNGERPAAYVAHAFGEIDGVFYTDSRDAFLLNYERGFRTFEVDLVLLRDGSAFCAHDGSEWMYGLDKPFTETTAAELTGRLCLGKYTPLTGSDLLDLIDEYTDACFLLDAKRTAENSSHAILKALVSEAKDRHLAVLNRIIPHTFGTEDLWRVAKIHHFRAYWAAVYSFSCNIDRSSGAEQDRIVLYAITSGGLAGRGPTPDTLIISALGGPALGLVHSLTDTRLYVSVDIIDADAAPDLA